MATASASEAILPPAATGGVANTGDATIGKLPGGRDPLGGLVISDTWVVFDVFVDDTAGPLIRPVIP